MKLKKELFVMKNTKTKAIIFIIINLEMHCPVG